MMTKSQMCWPVPLLLAVLTSPGNCLTQETTCEEGWFGSQCQYKCRCQNNTCDTQGSCTAGSTCQKGWFGPACQYIDVVAKDEWLEPRHWLADDDDDTCNPDPGLKSVSVQLKSGAYPAWIRIHVKDPSNLFDIMLTFSSDNSTGSECRGMVLTMVSCNTLDIHCDLKKTFSRRFQAPFLLLSGRAVQSLCSVYVSGGRNVALRQKTTQSSTSSRPFSDSSIAVDGINGQDSTSIFDEYNTSQTAVDGSDKSPTWSLTLSRPHVVTSYTAYFPNYPGQNGVKVSTYTGNCKLLNCDTFDPGRSSGFGMTKDPASSQTYVPIIGWTMRVPSDAIITLYEVELYGDTACRPGKYGRDCEHTCNCAVKDEACYVSTGGCPSGCALGYQGESCDQPCPPGQCTVGCSVNCSQFCHIPQQQLNQPSLRIVSDICLDGCQDDYQGLTCSFQDTTRGPTCGYGDSKEAIIYIGVGVGLGLLVVIIIVVVAVCMYRRRQPAAIPESGHHVRLSTPSGTNYQRMH